MAKTIDIFVDADQDLANFAGILKTLLNIQFNEIREADDTWHEYSDGNVLMRVGEHEFEQDRDMLFQEYRFHISIRAINVGNEKQRVEWRTGLATQVFSKLRDCARWRLMMVDDLQTKLVEYDPDDEP